MLKFETSTGNTYAWINDIGIFIPANPILSAILRETSDQNQISKINIIKKLGEDFDEKEVEYYYDIMKKYGGFRNGLKERFKCITNQNHKDHILKKTILRNGITQLILDVTEDCNFRCGYCIFSGNYTYYRSHSKRYMNISIAKKAIDYYFSLIIEGKKYNPLRQPTISFYGGEPLLNFKLIKECVEYIEEKYKDYKINYNLTTNGSLLNKEKAEWFMNRNCHILISICGPKEEHDRLRPYRDGRGTYKDIMKNIRPIIDDPRSKLGSSVVYDFKTDLFELEDFFNRHDVPTPILANLVAELDGCKYFEQFSETDKLMFKEQILCAQKCYINNFNNREENKSGSFFDLIFGNAFVAAINDPGSLTLNDSIIPYSGTCIPGKKLFVDVDGNFHICERINRNFSIGDVSNGLDFTKIGKILENYIQHLDKCPTCNMTRMCNRCFVNLSADKEFICTSKSCRNQELNEIKLLSDAFTFAEMNPKIVEKNLGRYHNVF